MPKPTSSVWDDFVALTENRSALRAVKRIVTAIQSSKKLPFDVLTLHGPPGSGKSHLAATAAMEIPGAMVITARDFARPKTGPDLRFANLLVVDGVHHFKPNTAAKFASLLETRAARRLLTIVTTAESPAELSKLPQRFTSRLIGGLVIHLGPLSVASRVRLVSRFAKDRHVVLPTEIVAAIAEKVPGGIRPMIGAVELWIAAKEMGAPYQLPGQVPKDIPDHPMARIVSKVSRVFGIPVEEIRGESQLKSIVTARQVAILIGHHQLKLKFPAIGTYLNRSGSTCFNAEAHLRWKMIRNPELNAKVNGLIDECREEHRKLVAQTSFL